MMNVLMKRVLLGAAICLMSALAAEAQVGKQFPAMPGETVEGAAVNLPEGVKGKYTLLGLAFSKKSDDALQTWFQPVYSQFIQKRKSGGLFEDLGYDVNVYFVPMFTGANKLAAGPARKKTLKNVDAELHPHILFYVGELATYRDQLGLKEKDEPYFFVLDPEGKIVYTTSGAFTKKKMEEVEAILDQGLE